MKQSGQNGLPMEIDQVFAFTDCELPQGMCGGAVVSADGRLVGMIEGIVSANRTELEKHVAAIACGKEISRWLQNLVV